MTQGLRTALEMPADERLARHEKLAKVVRESDSAAWSSSYYSALVKAGDRRLGKTLQSSPKMNEALDRLKAAIKKTVLLAATPHTREGDGCNF